MARQHTHRGPRCPRCGTRFGKDADVTNHMNQPWSKCASWMADLERILDPVKTNKINRYESDTSADLGFMDREVSDNEIDLEETLHTNQETRYVETFPGAGDTYGSGSTFMDGFKSDKYAGHRCQNIYYPFQTKSEWGLASWLLRSSLSMRAIDDFLKLELVSL
jgi:hypothetical protein